MQPLKEDEGEAPVEVKVEEYQVDEEEDQEEDNQRSRINYENQLISASKKGDIELIEKALNKKANVNVEDGKMKWTPIIWATCKGYTDIVKLLIARGGAEQYKIVDLQNRQIIAGSIREVKTNPLQWACFKGHTEIFLLLLKTGLHWEDVDQFGNNSVNLSAAGNHSDIFKLFLQYGVFPNVKNSRGHSVKQLSTDKVILDLQKKWSEAQTCFASNQPFKIQEIKHWCWICGNFFKKESFNVQWVYQKAQDVEQNYIDGRCTSCWNDLNIHSQNIEKAIQKNNEQALASVIEEKKAAGIKFQVKFIENALKVLKRLNKQNQIFNYIHSLAKVSNYKIILKAVDKIECMLKEAADCGIEFDEKALEFINKQKERLIAERNLRYLTDNIDTSVTTREDVSDLESVCSKAEDKKVSSEYLDEAIKLKDKMGRSILAQDLFQMFIEYPLRPDPYPAPLIIDPKTKRPLDPVTKKPTDPMGLLPKKKKGKKQPKFMIPQWATELKNMNDKIKQLEELLKLQQELNLSEQFMKKCTDAIALMKRQSRYRRDMTELQKIVDEILAKQKKAAG